MKRLFLTSQVQFVASSINSKLGSEVHKPMVFIDTCIHSRVHTDAELSWHHENKKQLEVSGFSFDIYDISNKTKIEIKNDLDKYEIMYIEGGNTAYLLQQSKENNFGGYIKKRIEDGMIYISTSAGSVIAGPDIASNGRPGKTVQDFGLTESYGFNLVNFVVLPHWGDPKKRNDYEKYKIPTSYQEKYPHVMLSDNQYVEVTDDWYKIVEVSA